MSNLHTVTERNYFLKFVNNAARDDPFHFCRRLEMFRICFLRENIEYPDSRASSLDTQLCKYIGMGFPQSFEPQLA